MTGDLPPLLGTKVNGQASFVPVGASEQHRQVLDINLRTAPMSLKGAVDGFDRDDIGAKIRDHLDAQRPHQEMVEADDPNAV